MKKIISILLILLMAVTFAACGNNEKDQSNDNNDTIGNLEEDDNNSEDNGVHITYFEDDYVPKYNDVFYDSAVDWIREDFQSNNLIHGAYYDDVPMPDSPSIRTFMVTDRDNYENIFVDNIEELDVDFDNEMIIVYTFAVGYVIPAYILDINLSGATLTVDYTIPLRLNAGAYRKPFQRWFVIKLDKLEITSAVFNEHDTYYKNV